MELPISAYLTDLTGLNCSEATVKNYRSTLKRFDSFLGGKEFTQESISEFMRTYENPASANVVRTRLLGLEKFMLGYRASRAKEPIKPVEALTSHEVALLVTAARLQSDELAAAIIFFTETGLRFQEFCNFDVTQMRSERDPHSLKINTAFNVVGKGRKHREVPVSVVALTVVHHLPFIRTRNDEDKFRYALAKAGIDAGLTIRIHPHLLRATFMSVMLNERNTEAIMVAKIVGHSSVDTMLRHYLRTSISKLCNVVNA